MVWGEHVVASILSFDLFGFSAQQFRKFNSELEKGYTIVCGTNQGLYARVKKHPSLLVLSSTDEKGVKSEKKVCASL